MPERRVPLHLDLTVPAYSSLYPDFLPPSSSDMISYWHRIMSMPTFQSFYRSLVEYIP